MFDVRMFKTKKKVSIEFNCIVYELFQCFLGIFDIGHAICAICSDYFLLTFEHQFLLLGITPLTTSPSYDIEEQYCFASFSIFLLHSFQHVDDFSSSQVGKNVRGFSR